MVIHYYIGIILLACAFMFMRRDLMHRVLAGVVLSLQCAFTLYEITQLNKVGFDFFTPDDLGVLFLVLLGILMIPTYYHSLLYLEKNNAPMRVRNLYLATMTLFCGAMSGVYLSNHIGMTWIFVELTTITSALLIYHHRDAEALEATWKYVFVCSVSVALSFAGVLIMSIAMNQAGLENFTYREMAEHSSRLDPFWLKIGFLFLFSGYTVKAGLFPMFTAGVDAKDQAPTPAAAMLATGLCNCGFVAILRIYQIVAHNEISEWAQKVMLISAILSIAIAAYYMVRTKGYKRLLAYSGVEHIGLAAIGLAMGGQGYFAALLHVILHSLVKAALFFQFGQVSYIYKSVKRNDIGNYFRINVWGGLVLLIGFFCITAMPPSGMFVSET
ncbi:MAG: hydrogenase 4 subunit F, partial [Bacteroidales bacterium]|nr:hydrogenase 4 subunit F [Bacteroidales bacterium]